MKTKIRIWSKRYLPAEIFATLGALAGGLSTNIIFNNSLITAFGATWGENLGYYGVIIFRDLRKKHKEHKKVTFSILLRVLRNMIIEFGPAESLDSFLIRPFAMYFFPILLNNLTLGLLIGKFAADFTFYIPTIISYELRTKFLND